MNEELCVSYLDENDFKRKKQSLRKYCPQAFKFLVFDLRSRLENTTQGKHKIKLPTSEEFKFVHGQIELIYSIRNNTIIFEDIKPSDFLLKGYVRELDTYNGIFIKDKTDIFKINLLRKMKRD